MANISSDLADLGTGLGSFMQAITVPVIFLAVGLGVGYAVARLVGNAIRGAHR